VLAVGDAAFQKKCLGKMGDVAKEGRTVLLVSHNMPVIDNVCERCLLLCAGKIGAHGDSASVIQRYHQGAANDSSVSVGERTDRSGTGEVRCVKVSLLDGWMNDVPFVAPGQPCYIALEFEAREELRDVMVGIGIDTPDGTRLLTLFSELTNQAFAISEKHGRFLCSIPGLNLRPDTYLISTFLGNRYGAFDHVLDAATLAIGESDFFNTGRLPDRAQGPILVAHSWLLI
jgi:lipopolysaccharide transport system ATP-binding protein